MVRLLPRQPYTRAFLWRKASPESYSDSGLFFWTPTHSRYRIFIWYNLDHFGTVSLRLTHRNKAGGNFGVTTMALSMDWTKCKSWKERQEAPRDPQGIGQVLMVLGMKRVTEENYYELRLRLDVYAAFFGKLCTHADLENYLETWVGIETNLMDEPFKRWAARMYDSWKRGR